MKKSLLYIVIALLQFSFALAENDEFSKKPEPMPEKNFNFPEFETVDLDNGLKVFLVEDHEQPTFSIRMLIPGGKAFDTLKPGTADLLSALMTKGCDGYSASNLAETLDGMGVNLSVSASSDFFAMEASGLMKHFEKVSDIFKKVLLAPSFPEDELSKLKKQMLSSLQQEKGDPRTLAAKLGSKAIYGENHPYATYPTPESVNSIEIDDIKNFYEKYFIPNTASIAVIGDFNSSDFSLKIEDMFTEWEKGEELKFEINLPKPMPLGVYFIERPGSVQSTINITFRGLPFGTRDYDKLNLAGSVISGGISGRLFRNLREKYSYTYSPFGSLTQKKSYGRYYCGADVKNNVTDSAITVTLDLIRSLGRELPADIEVMRVKNYKAGAYKMAYENTGFLAVLIQNAYFYDVPLEYLTQYPKRISSYNNYDIKSTAGKYLNTDKAFIIVVGSPEVKTKLTQYGKIFDYDTDLNPLSGENAKLEEISMDAEELIENYIDAIGGLEKIQAVTTLYDSVYTEMNNGGELMTGTLIQYQQAPKNKYFIMDMKLFKQEAWVKGNKVWIKAGDMLQELHGKEADKYSYDAILFKDANLLNHGYDCKVLGKQRGKILMKAISPRGFESTYYFNEESYLIEKIERIEEMSGGKIPITETIMEYSELDGIKLAKVIETTTPLYSIKTVHNYRINIEIDENIFEPK